jgi:hypothetical protein
VLDRSIDRSCRSISEDSLRRYVSYASESCIQELLAASSDSGRGGDDDGWKVLVYHNGVEISKRRTGPAHVFRSRWLLQDVSPEQFVAAASAVDAAKVHTHTDTTCMRIFVIITIYS